MIKIAITPEVETKNESRFIMEILDAGWNYVHLRRPSASITEIRKLIESLPQRYHERLRLHGHFELINEFNLGGLHLNHRCPAAPELYRGKCSRSCHSLKDISNSDDCDYVTLSPIFDSISKHGYKAAFSEEELLAINRDNVIALGGVNAKRIDVIKRYPFAGFAMLGFLFNSRDTDELKSKLKLIDTKVQYATIYNTSK